MSEKHDRPLVGGPLDGHTVAIDDQVNAIDIGAEHAGMYHRIHKPATEPDMERWNREGVFEMNFEMVWFEWHDRDWVSPHVQAIRDAVTHAATAV